MFILAYFVIRILLVSVVVRRNKLGAAAVCVTVLFLGEKRMKRKSSSIIAHRVVAKQCDQIILIFLNEPNNINIVSLFFCIYNKATATV